MPNQNRHFRLAGPCLAGLIAAVFAGGVKADALDSSVQVQSNIQQQAAQSQQRIDALANESEDLLGKYRQAVRATDSLKVYNAQLEKVVANQDAERAAIDRQLANLEETNRGIVPLLLEMITMLEQIVANDVPFKKEDRVARVADLRGIIDRADVTTSEKYRRVMEAYQLEMEYGRSVDSYQAELDGRNVDFLRIGRTMLFYQTLDLETTGWFNPGTRQFEPLPTEFRAAVRDGLRIAKNQSAPNLVSLPVPAPVNAQ